MKRLIRKHSSIGLLALAIILAVSSFFLFRLLLSGRASSYTSEIAAAFVGSLLTIIITAVMLNKQSEVDMRKDRSAKMLENKWAVYSGITDVLEELLMSDTVTKASRTKVQILSQKVAFIAGKGVVEAFGQFVESFARASQDGKLSDSEIDELLGLAGELSLMIRYDLASQEDREAFRQDEADLRKSIVSSVQVLKREKTSIDAFMAACSEADKRYFREVIECAGRRGVVPVWGTVGFSLGGSVQCYPTSSRFDVVVVKNKLDASKLKSLQGALKNGQESVEGRAKLTLNAGALPAEDLCRLLDGRN